MASLWDRALCFPGAGSAGISLRHLAPLATAPFLHDLPELFSGLVPWLFLYQGEPDWLKNMTGGDVAKVTQAETDTVGDGGREVAG